MHIELFLCPYLQLHRYELEHLSASESKGA